MLTVTSCLVHLCPTWQYILQLSSAARHVANWGELRRIEVLHSSKGGRKHSTCHRGLRGNREDTERCWCSAVYVPPSISVSFITPLPSRHGCAVYQVFALFWHEFPQSIKRDAESECMKFKRPEASSPPLLRYIGAALIFIPDLQCVKMIKTLKFRLSSQHLITQLLVLYVKP